LGQFLQVEILDFKMIFHACKANIANIETEYSLRGGNLKSSTIGDVG